MQRTFLQSNSWFSVLLILRVAEETSSLTHLLFHPTFHAAKGQSPPASRSLYHFFQCFIQKPFLTYQDVGGAVGHSRLSGEWDFPYFSNTCVTMYIYTYTPSRELANCFVGGVARQSTPQPCCLVFWAHSFEECQLSRLVHMYFNATAVLLHGFTTRCSLLALDCVVRLYW